MGFNTSVTVAVGFIALAGVAAETGVVLAEVREARAAAGRVFKRGDLDEAIMLGAVDRIRPKMMTVVAIMAGLLPILWSTGPMIGGMVSSTVLTLMVIPTVYALIKGWRLPISGRAIGTGQLGASEAEYRMAAE